MASTDGTQAPVGLVGPYRLLQRLAAGGMGEVWRAWDTRLKRPVAVKHVLGTILDQPQARERFRREAEAGARLNHPVIVQIYDLVESPDGDWLVMELVEGQTLRQLLAAGPVAPDLAVRLGREIAEGLAAAHAQGVLHRDLKAGNVMMTAAGHAKILDFGIAKLRVEEQDATLPGVVLGTSYAMSPEQALGLPLDARSDLFSLGSLLYEMVTGEAPFLADTAAATMARVCHLRPAPARQLRPEVPAELSGLIARLLEKNPALRPGSAAEVAGALGRRAAKAESTAETAAETTAETKAELRVPPPATEDGTTLLGPAYRPEQRTLSGSLFPRPVRILPSLVLAAVLVALGLAWKAEVLPMPRRGADLYELYEAGAEALRRYDKKGHLDEAIAAFQRVLAREPDHAPALAALARAYQLKSLNDSKDRVWLEQALPLAQRAVELDGYLASARVSLGLVYTSLGRLDDATRELERALQLEPLNADAQFGLAKVHEARTQLDQAEAAFRRAIARRPDRQFYDALGALYLRTSRVDRAVDAFRRSIQLAPDGYMGYRNLGTALFLRGDLAHAATQFQKALEIQPQASLYANLGTVYFAQGIYPEAVQAFERALEQPGGANDYLLWGNLGDAYRWTPDGGERAREAYTRALQLLDERLRATAEDATLRSRRVLYLAKQGDCEQALAAAQAAAALLEKEAASGFRLVVAREVCRQRAAALATLGRALRAGFPLSEVQRDPELLGLRSDPRYHRLLVQQGGLAASPP